MLLVTEGFGGADSSGGGGGVEGGEQGDADGDSGDEDAVEEARGEGKRVDGVDVGRELDVVVAAGPRADVAEDEAEHGSDDADEQALQKEDAADLCGDRRRSS